MSVLISCEVGGDLVPSLFVRPARTALPHRLPGDASAKYVAQAMAKHLGAKLIANPYSLELVDVTRSLHHRDLFSSLTRSWPTDDRQRLIDTIYEPYRSRVRNRIRALLDMSPYVIHLSVRTFDLRRSDGRIRRADVGLLYDPAVEDEVDLCVDWVDEMYDEVPMLRVRRNYPRRGTIDSLTRAMRSEFSGQDYLGIEVMLNRAWAQRAVALREEAIRGICWSLQAITELSHSEAA